tara:strand:- start:3499 stop:4689 length:1191 start_codon:yes stop_codon:yes gene_type:complete
MKILRIINRFNVGGPTHNATFLTKYLAPDYETKLVAGKKLDSEATSEYILNEYEIDYLILKNMNRSLNIFKDLKAFFEIRRIIKEFKPDIVHTHASKSGALGRLAAMSLRVPLIFHTFHGHVFHSYFGFLKTFFYITIERFLAKNSSAIIAISDSQKDELVNKFKICSENNIRVIPLGFDLEKFQLDKEKNRRLFREEFKLSDDVVAIGIIGRLTAIKNHKFFLKAIKNSMDVIQNPIKVFIVGDGEDFHDLEDYAISLELTTSKKSKYFPDATIQFISWRSDMDIVYAGLDIVALSSLNEGTPVTLIEAQAANKPVISTMVGGVEDIVDTGVTGLLSKPNDLDQYVKNLITLIDNKKLRLNMSNNGYKNVSKKFSYKRLVNDVKCLYKNFLKDVK